MHRAVARQGGGWDEAGALIAWAIVADMPQLDATQSLSRRRRLM
jgi:hypothetical protein